MADGGNSGNNTANLYTLLVALAAMFANLARPVVDYILDRRKAKRDRRHHSRHPGRRKND